LKFKKAGDVYFVQYEENGDIKSLKIEDEPENELITAMDNLALATLSLFKINDVTCKLQVVEWKDREKASSKVILLSGESTFGQFKMALPKVSTQDAETPKDGYDLDNLKNQYNNAATVLREEVKRFLKSMRRQRVLPFKEDGQGKKKGIVNAATDKVGKFFKGEKKK
jgi:hypothetical protein